MKKFGKKENKNIFAVLAIFLFCNICLFSYTPTPAFATVSTYATTLTNISASSNLLGSGIESDPYQIASANDLQYLNQYAQPKYYKLLNNIDLKGKYFTPIRNSSAVFSGVFDGNGFEIKNWVYELNGDIPSNNYGLFASISASGIIKNLTMSNCNIKLSGLKKNAYIGMIAGSCNAGKIILCKNINSTITTKNAILSSTIQYVGGIVGRVDGSSKIDSCTNNFGNIGVNSNNDCYVGGIIGYVDVNAKINHCINNANITLINVSLDSANSWLGGIIGYSNSDITLSLNKGKISGNSSKSTLLIAGIVGESSADISQCANEAQISTTLTSPTTYAGGIVGRVSDYSSQLNNTSSGNVSTPMREEPGDDDIGGGGSISNADVSITDCYNKGTLSINPDTKSSGAVGGIIGSVNNGVIVDVTRCYNIGQIDSLIGFEDKNAIYDNPEKNWGDEYSKFNYFNTTIFDYRKKQGGIIGDKLSGTCNVNSTCESTSTSYKFDISLNYAFQAEKSCDLSKGDSKWHKSVAKNYVQSDETIRTWFFNKIGYTPDTDFMSLIKDIDKNYVKSTEYFSQDKKYPYLYGIVGWLAKTPYVHSLMISKDRGFGEDYDFALHSTQKYYDLNHNTTIHGYTYEIPSEYKNHTTFASDFVDNIYYKALLPSYYYYDIDFDNSDYYYTFKDELIYSTYFYDNQELSEYNEFINDRTGTVLEITYVKESKGGYTIDVGDDTLYIDVPDYQDSLVNIRQEEGGDYYVTYINGDATYLYQWIYVEDVNPEGNALSTLDSIQSANFGSNWATNASINGGYPYLKNLYW